MSSISPLTYSSTENYGRIQAFAGLMQQGDGYNLNLGYAADGKNFDTSNGVLTPYTKGSKLQGDLPAPIGTLAALYRRYGDYVEPTLLIASAGGKLYARVLGSSDWGNPIYTGLQSDDFDYVTYEVNTWNGQQLASPVDVLLISNAQDGMLCIRGDNMSVAEVNTPKKFGVLARHAERIWGSGIEGEPDLLVYSAPYDPFNWEPNSEIPEDGAGDIVQPSWDGDSFVALRPFGSQLIAFKRHRVWRILGTDPGTYIMKEQYGGGTVAEDTVAVSGDYILMLGEAGVMMYDGGDVSPFRQEAVRHIMRRMNRLAIKKACATIHDNRYYLALPLDDSMVNNAVLIYNIPEQTFNLIEGVSVRAFLDMYSELLYTSDTTPSSVWSTRDGDVLPVHWHSTWQDNLLKNVSKTAFEVLLASSETAEIRLGIRTENRLKSKQILLQAGHQKRVRLSNKGRRWRLEIDSASGETARWALIGGVQIMMELDYD